MIGGFFLLGVFQPAGGVLIVEQAAGPEKRARAGISFLRKALAAGRRALGANRDVFAGRAR